MIAWDHWHIEASSICALKCPRCPRAEIPDSLLNRQLSLTFFKDQIGETVIQNIKKITFCGNDGDPIYNKEFIEICEWLKTVNPAMSLIIITNGSHKLPEWWSRLGNVLNSNDEINWSIDGWDQVSNEKYRINSNWQSIEDGIRSFTTANSSAYRVWASIGFKFNQDNIEHQKQIATTLGFDLFQLTKSTKFGSKYPDAYGKDDLLEPTIQTLVAAGHRFERKNTVITTKERPGSKLKMIFMDRASHLIRNKNYSGICLIGNKGLFLNSMGELYPCCWTANRYEHNTKWHTLAKQQFNLKVNTFDQIINNPFWATEFLKFDSLECTTKCTAEKLQDISHTTEW